MILSFFIISKNLFNRLSFRQKLDIQLKETEHLKSEMARSRQPFATINYPTTETQYQTQGSIFRAVNASGLSAQSLGSFNNTNNSNNFVDELIDMRVKLKESYAINEELKLTFRTNLNELQNTLGECVEDKEKLMINLKLCN